MKDIPNSFLSAIDNIQIEIKLQGQTILNTKVQNINKLSLAKKDSGNNQIKYNKNGDTFNVFFEDSSIIEYIFEKQQNLEIYLAFSDNYTFKNSTTLGRIMGSRKNGIILNTDRGNLCIDCLVASGRDIECFINCNITVDNPLFIGKKLFLVLSNFNSDVSWRKIFKTEEVKLTESCKSNNYSNTMNRQNPNTLVNTNEKTQYSISFNAIDISADLLNNNDFNRPILVEVYEVCDSNKSFCKLLDTEVLLQPHQENQNCSYMMTPNDKAYTRRPKINGTNYIPTEEERQNQYPTVLSINVTNNNFYELIINYSKAKKVKFLDLLYKGMQISLCVGIDFTGSNGHPFDEISLHYCLNKDKPNDYEKAISACAKIVAYYDYDQQFPLLGFGGIPDGEDKVSHCFPLNMNKLDPNVFGVQGIIDTYKSSLSKVTLSNPTLFSPLITGIIRFVKSNIEKIFNVYYLIMILTDGIIDDIPETLALIQEYQNLPVGFIIVGIGSSNFSAMENLFSEIKNVNFVGYKMFEDNPAKLAEYLLKNVPGQVEEYFQNNPMIPQQGRSSVIIEGNNALPQKNNSSNMNNNNNINANSNNMNIGNNSTNLNYNYSNPYQMNNYSHYNQFNPINQQLNFMDNKFDENNNNIPGNQNPIPGNNINVGNNNSNNNFSGNVFNPNQGVFSSTIMNNNNSNYNNNSNNNFNYTGVYNNTNYNQMMISNNVQNGRLVNPDGTNNLYFDSVNMGGTYARNASGNNFISTGQIPGQSINNTNFNNKNNNNNNCIEEVLDENDYPGRDNFGVGTYSLSNFGQQSSNNNMNTHNYKEQLLKNNQTNKKNN